MVDRNAAKIADTNLGHLRLAASLRRRTGPRSDLRADLVALLDALAASTLVDRTEAQKKLGDLPDSDRRIVTREILETMRTDPVTQVVLSESVGELLADEALLSEIATLAEALGCLARGRRAHPGYRGRRRRDW